MDDHAKWVLSRKDLDFTPLERLAYEFSALIKDYLCASTNYEGLFFKSDRSYTDDGYSLGSLIWYMDVIIQGHRVSVYGKRPENVYQNAIDLFERCLNAWHDEPVIKLVIKEFKQSQKRFADQRARYV